MINWQTNKQTKKTLVLPSSDLSCEYSYGIKGLSNLKVH